MKKACVHCGKQIPSVALNCVFCSSRQPAPDFSDVDVLLGAVERAQTKASAATTSGMYDEDDQSSQVEHTLVGLRVADLGPLPELEKKPVEAPANGSSQARPTAAVPVVTAKPEPQPEARPEPKPVEVKPAIAPSRHPWEALGRGVMGIGGAVLIALFFLPWRGASSWQLLETLAGADFIRQLFYLAGGIVLLTTALLPLPFAFRALVGASVAALPVILGARGLMDGWRGLVAALAVVALPATHLLRSRAQRSPTGRALVLAAVAAVALLYLLPVSSVMPIALVFKMIFSGSISLLVMGLFILVPAGFAAMSLLGVLGRDLADIEVLLSVLILLWGPVMVALRGMMMEDTTQLYVALALLWASATAAVSLAQLLSLAAPPRA